MIQLLFVVLFAEGVVAFLMLVKIGPLRELVIKSLDQVKMGKGPATVKTIAGTMSVILISSFISIVKIQNKGVKLGTMSPMDQVLWRTHLLEASLMGFFPSLLWLNDTNPAYWLNSRCIMSLHGQFWFTSHSSSLWLLLVQPHWPCTLSNHLSCSEEHALTFTQKGFTLFLGFIIDRMHHYLSKLIGLRSSVGASKEELDRLQKETIQLKEKEEKASQEVKQLQAKISTLTEDLKKLKLECAEKDKSVETAESHVASLQKQAADLLLEYDRLLEDNQNLQNQSLGYRS